MEITRMLILFRKINSRSLGLNRRSISQRAAIRQRFQPRYHLESKMTVEGFEKDWKLLFAGERNEGEVGWRILSALRARCPEAKVPLLGVFPRDHKPDGKLRKINDEINKRIAKFADGERVHFMDIGDKFLAEDGTLPKAIMPDFLHPKAEGYKIWAEAIEPKLKEFGL